MRRHRIPLEPESSAQQENAALWLCLPSIEAGPCSVPVLAPGGLGQSQRPQLLAVAACVQAGGWGCDATL